MSVVNPVTVLTAINDGHTTSDALAQHFDVDTGDYSLRSAINDLVHHRHIAVDRKAGHITVAEEN